MECQSSDSKKLFKVFDASKRKRTRKKREGLDDSNSLATDDSVSGCQPSGALRASSAKVSLQDVPTAQTVAVTTDRNDAKRGQDSSPSVTRSPDRERRSSRSPRRHRRSTREGVSLALKAGLVSTPRSISTHQINPKDMECAMESIPQDQDSFIYAFLEQAIKRDKKRQRERHSRRHEERRASRDESPSQEYHHRHHHRRRRDDDAKERESRPKDEEPPAPAIDQAALFETFAKLCATLNEKNANFTNTVPRTLSHKSLQCEVVSRRDPYDVDHQPERLRSHEYSRENVSKTRSQENFRGRGPNYSQERVQAHGRLENDKCACCCDKDPAKYSSKVNMTRSRMRNNDDERYPDYTPEIFPPRNHMDHGYRPRVPENRDYRDYDREFAREKHFDHDKRRYCEQKTTRSYEVHRDGYPDDDKFCRRTARSDNNREKHYEDREKYYEEKHIEPRERFLPSHKDRRAKRNGDRYDRNSIASRDDDYRDRDRYSERERDSGLSVADGETSTISGKSNCLKVVKQEIAEQREAMDKMMKLWKELMRCFKGMSAQGQNKSQVHESAANVQESAAAQLRLWRECMRRYETVARDVGDTDARLMEEINKQRSEMAEMASMWQECLQRYREMSSDFNSLKQQVTVTKHQFVTPESPTRLPAAPVACAEGERIAPPAAYPVPPNYPPMPPMGAGYGGGSPLRGRASAPPAWWWCAEAGARESPRRRSSPDSRGSRDRRRDADRRRHKDRDRDDSRYKEKSSKPSGARSEHRHRKR